MKKGFSLIELLVVFAIIALILGIAIPGFSNYNKNQMLKTAAYELKAVLREAQNASLQGKKETCKIGGCTQGSCSNNDTLIGHYVTFDLENNPGGYLMGIRCNADNPKDYSVKEVQLSNNGTVNAISIAYFLGETGTSKNLVTVMFKPVTGGVRFIFGLSDAPEETTPIDRLEVVLSNGSQDHAIIISSSGDIYETKDF